jgi:Protein of unknown function (DUF4058)
MPLLDHFHSPISEGWHWESFHTAWATHIMGALNLRILPPGYRAGAQLHVGRVEVDVPTFEQSGSSSTADGNGGVVVEAWAPPTATLTMPALFPDEIEVQVFSTTSGLTLVGAVELVSPGNKDRPEERRAFAMKCGAYLQQRIGLVIVDIVTARLANLHNELIRLLEQPADYRFPSDPSIYAVAYRPLHREPSGDQIDLWMVPLTIGQPLPTMPLALRDGPVIPIELEATYSDARRFNRL